MTFNIKDRIAVSKIFAKDVAHYCDFEEIVERLFPGAIDAAYTFYVENVLSGKDDEDRLCCFVSCNPSTQMEYMHGCLDIHFHRRNELSFRLYNSLSDEDEEYYWRFNKWTKE